MTMIAPEELGAAPPELASGAPAVLLWAASAFFLGLGLLGLAAAAYAVRSPQGLDAAALASVSGLSVAAGASAPALPWRRWPTPALLALAVLALVLVAAAGW
ncbi:MAG: hypothetical protein ACKVWR_10495, partial [Acidimicrobiales bacterium]